MSLPSGGICARRELALTGCQVGGVLIPGGVNVNTGRTSGRYQANFNPGGICAFSYGSGLRHQYHYHVRGVYLGQLSLIDEAAHVLRLMRLLGLLRLGRQLSLSLYYRRRHLVQLSLVDEAAHVGARELRWTDYRFAHPRCHDRGLNIGV